MESFNPRGETAYTVRGLSGNKVLEIASDFAMTLGEIHTHVHYLDHISQTTSRLFWDENGEYHRSELRDDGMPNSKTGPLVPFGSTVQVILQATADSCWSCRLLVECGGAIVNGWLNMRHKECIENRTEPVEAFAAQNAQLFQTLADAKADEWIN